MNDYFRCFLFFILLIPAWTGYAKEKGVSGKQILYPRLVDIPPKIDGDLDDRAWEGEPLINGPFIEYKPEHGLVLQERTKVYISYDPDNIYVAFYCFVDPNKVKATIARRDNIFAEDFIYIGLDTMGNRKWIYGIGCNALGIQTDLLNSVSSGASSDPDWVWYSAGKIVEDGYTVEMQIPLKSFKFKSGEDVQMNLAILRGINHSGVEGSWPEISQERGYFNSLAPIVFKKLNKQLKLDVIPTVTYGSLWDRESPEVWSPADDAADIGVSVKYGINSSVSAELTANPDFSQVESDQFQILANQRYPVFNIEKRPFFMDVGNQFNLTGTGGASNISTAVYTRGIVDPAWGAKVTGDLGKFSFGFLGAGDEYPGREWEEEINLYLGINASTLRNRMKKLKIDFQRKKGDAF
jgi:hypothetical protein